MYLSAHKNCYIPQRLLLWNFARKLFETNLNFRYNCPANLTNWIHHRFKKAFIFSHKYSLVLKNWNLFQILFGRQKSSPIVIHSDESQFSFNIEFPKEGYNIKYLRKESFSKKNKNKIISLQWQCVKNNPNFISSLSKEVAVLGLSHFYDKFWIVCRTCTKPLFNLVEN